MRPGIGALIESGPPDVGAVGDGALGHSGDGRDGVVAASDVRPKSAGRSTEYVVPSTVTSTGEVDVSPISTS